MAQPQSEGADDTALRGAKEVLRAAVLRRRDARPADRREADDHHRFRLVSARLESSPAADGATVACYLSVAPEPGTLELIAWLAARGVRVLLPRLAETGPVSASTPDWTLFAGSDQLVTGRWGLIEPTGPRLGADAVAAADLIVVPGLAATERGDRLGRGGGWYDRALAHVRAEAPRLILLNDDEVLSTVPAQSWDRPVTAIATPTRWLDC